MVLFAGADGGDALVDDVFEVDRVVLEEGGDLVLFLLAEVVLLGLAECVELVGRHLFVAGEKRVVGCNPLLVYGTHLFIKIL